MRVKDKNMFITVVSVAAVLSLAIVAVLLIRWLGGSQPTTTIPPIDNNSTVTAPGDDLSSNSSSNSDSSTNPDNPSSVTSGSSDQSQSTTTPSKSQVESIDIEPLGISVSYLKGSGGFEFEVLRTPNGTKYVEFRSPKLIGSKCTNDLGTFATILKNPSQDEATTISQTVDVAGDKYGLSLAGNSCTDNQSLLSAYQASFSDAFKLLKKMPEN